MEIEGVERCWVVRDRIDQESAEKRKTISCTDDINGSWYMEW